MARLEEGKPRAPSAKCYAPQMWQKVLSRTKQVISHLQEEYLQGEQKRCLCRVRALASIPQEGHFKEGKAYAGKDVCEEENEKAQNVIKMNFMPLVSCLHRIKKI